MASIVDLTMSNHPKLENRTLELQILAENLQHLVEVLELSVNWNSFFRGVAQSCNGLLPVSARYFQSRSYPSHPRRSWPWISADLASFFTQSGWWCWLCPSWKIWVRQWEGWHLIYEMENNSHVWNHQPDDVLIQTLGKLPIYRWFTY